MKIKTILIIPLMAVSITGFSYAGEIPVFPDEFKAEKISSFTEYLISSGEYYRAYVELDRLKSYYSGYLSPLTYNVTRSYILFKSGRYDHIIKGDSPVEDDEGSCITGLFKIDSILKSGSTGEAAGLLSAAGCESEDLIRYFDKRRAYVSVLNRFNNRECNATPEFDGYRDSAAYADYLHDMKKSPPAGAAAGIIPGMGYVYAGERGTGIVALIAVSAGSAITYGAYNTGVTPLAVISGAATLFMYAGSILGGYRETVKYNRRLSERLVLRLENDFMLDKDLDEIYVNFGIKSNVR